MAHRVPSLATRAAFVAALQRLGGSGFHLQAALLPTMRFWQAADLDAHVAFCWSAGVWLAAGEPLAAAADVPLAMRQFVQAAAAAGARAAFFGVTGPTAALAGLWHCPVGMEPICLPARWYGPSARPRPAWARQVRRARRHVRLAVASKAEVAAQAGPVAEAWQARHAMPPLAFLATPSLRCEPQANVLHVCAYSGRGLEGVAVVLLAQPDGRALIEHLVRRPDAPNGTAEALIDEAMRRLPCAQVSLGLVALSGPVRPWARGAARLGGALYSFAGLAAFRRRALPDAVVPVGLACASARGAPRVYFAVAMAFVGARPWRFAWQFLWRGPPLLLWAQSVALVPWTLALLWAPVTPYFVHARTQQAWVIFDAVLAMALAIVAYRPRPALARVLAWVVSGDAVLTGLEACLGPPVQTPGQALIRIVLVLAPVLSAAVLWGTWRRLRRLHGLRASKGTYGHIA